MADIQHLTARALARALFAGAPGEAPFEARMSACLGGERPVWLRPLAQRLARLPREVWRRLEVAELAARIEADAGYVQAWRGEAPPSVHRYLLRPRQELLPLPLGLEGLELPQWPTVGQAAAGLGLSPAGLWRLSLPAGWQRRGTISHYRCELLPKRSGSGWRMLEVPAPYLRAVQRRLLDQLLAGLPVHEAAFGYARGRSVLAHAQHHVGQAWLLRLDLRDFFSQVSAARVHALFATLGYPQAVASTLTALCTTATPESVLRAVRGSMSWLQAQRLRDAHLPQGAPTSPALANLAAFGLDCRLAGLAQRFGLRYSRYADDLVFSGGSESRGALQRLHAWVREIVRDEGFELNQAKTRHQRAAGRQTVCGIVVNQRPNLPRDEFDRLKALLHRCVIDGPGEHNRDGHADWRGHLHGRVAWAAQLNPVKAERLKRLLDRIDWAR